MCSWRAVFQTTATNDMPAPATNAVAAISHVGASSASRATCGVQRSPAHVAARSGQRGRTRSATSPPPSSPSPDAARMSAHAPAPPSESRAITAPSTMNGPSTSMCQTAYWSTMTHTHVRARNSDQPSASSATNPALSAPRSCSGGCIASRANALTTNVPASVARAAPGPANAITAPPTAGPSTPPDEWAIPSRAFARWSWGALTVCGTRPVDAGSKNAAPTPWTATIAT